MSAPAPGATPDPGAAGAAGLAETGADERSADAGADERSAEADADEAASPETVEKSAAEPAKPGGRWWRGFTGSLAAGLTVLAVGVLVVAGVCLYTGAPGPGSVLLIGHPVAAALALLAQRVADRRNGLPAAGAGVAVVLFTVSALTLFWLT
jgi:predicted lipid-binding transport protein (Tim44 family)